VQIIPASEETTRKHRGELSQLVQQWIEETGKEKFRASDIVPYLEARGHKSKYHPNSVYNTLIRWTKDDKLKKDGKDFVVVKR
jgi:hypothetical protein